MLALALYNDNGPFTAVLAADVIWKNYRSGFLPITDSSGNQLSVPINRQNRYIGRPLIYVCVCMYVCVYIYIYIYIYIRDGHFKQK